MQIIHKPKRDSMKLTDQIEKLDQTQILLIGDVMLGRYLWGDLQRISPGAPVSIVVIQEKTVSLGGVGHTAANLAGLKCRTV